MSLNQSKDRNNLSAEDVALFYRNGLVICVSLYLATLLLRNSQSNSAGLSESHPEELWTVVCSSIMVPFVGEFLLDVAVTTFMAEVEYPHAAEDKLGHSFILFSLIPCSHLSLWVFEATIPQIRVGLIGLSHTLFVCGVLGKLLSFGPQIWSKFDMDMVYILFSISQLIVLFKSWAHISAFVSGILKLLCTIKFFVSSQKLFNQETFGYLSEGRTNTLFFTSNVYLCFILSIGMFLFLSCSTFGTWRYLHLELSLLQHNEFNMIIHLFGVVALTVLPGRVLRRGLAAVEYLQQLQKELNSKKTFIRYISHEIRSPLSTTSLGIDCMISLLQAQNKQLTPIETELFDLAKDSKVTCAAAIHTLNDLLLFDKIENNMLQLDIKDLKCVPFFEDCIHPFVRQLAVAGIDFQVYFDTPLERMLFRVDQFKLEQVVRNFISNSIKFTPIGGKITVNILVKHGRSSKNAEYPTRPCSGESGLEPTSLSDYNENSRQPLLSHASSIRVKLMNSDHITNHQINLSDKNHNDSNVDLQTNPSGGIIRFEVFDTGAGISKENQQKLFQQYVQFDAAKLQGGKGSGLGLWISKAIIDKLGGQVGAFSEGEGKGAMFYFELPCYEIIASNRFDNHEEQVQKSITTSHASPLNFPSVVPDALVDPLQERVEVDENFPKSPIPQTSGKLTKVVDTNTKQSIATIIPQLELPPSIAGIQGTNVLRREELRTSSDSTDTPNSGSCQKSEESVLATESNTNLQQLETIDPLVPLPQLKPSKPALITNNSTLATPRSLFTKDSEEVLSSRKLQLQSPSCTNSTHGARSHSSDDCAISDRCSSSHIGNELKVLLADDAVLSRKMVDRLLQPLHVNCIHASNGKEAVDAVVASLQQNEIPFDVIIIDYYMPEMDGPEAIKAMRQANFRGLICAVTGSTSATDHEKLLLNGANVIMSKPFNVKIFQQALREYVKHAK